MSVLDMIRVSNAVLGRGSTSVGRTMAAEERRERSASKAATGQADDEAAGMRPIVTPTVALYGATMEAIHGYIMQSSAPVRQRDIHNDLGIDRSQISKALKTMMNDGLVIYVNRKKGEGGPRINGYVVNAPFTRRQKALKPSGHTAAVLKVLREAGREVSTLELRDAIGVPRASINSSMRILIDRGLITKTTRNIMSGAGTPMKLNFWRIK